MLNWFWFGGVWVLVCVFVVLMLKLNGKEEMMGEFVNKEGWGEVMIWIFGVFVDFCEMNVVMWELFCYDSILEY